MFGDPDERAEVAGGQAAALPQVEQEQALLGADCPLPRLDRIFGRMLPNCHPR
jgi:hypothetical protein